MTLDDWLFLYQITVPALLVVGFIVLTFAYLRLQRFVIVELRALREAQQRCPRDKYNLFGEWQGRCVRTDVHKPAKCRTIDDGPER